MEKEYVVVPTEVVNITPNRNDTATLGGML